MLATEVRLKRWEILVVFLAVTISFTVGLVLLTRATHKTDRLVRQNRAVLAAVIAANRTQTLTIRQLCNRGFIIDEFVVASEELQERLAVADARRRREDAARARLRAAAEFARQHTRLLRSLTEPASLCRR